LKRLTGQKRPPLQFSTPQETAMKAPLRSHGFDKPSDLDDHLAELDEEAAEKEAVKPAAARRARAAPAESSLRAELEDLRKQLEKIRRDVKRLEAASNTPHHKFTDARHERDRENSRLMTVVRSVAVTSLASRIFASSPVMAALVAVVPIALGLAARRNEGA
jgi:chromosome segregation ATPase